MSASHRGAPIGLAHGPMPAFVGALGGRAADDVGLQFGDPGAHAGFVDVVRHRVDEVHVGVAAVLQVAGQVGRPGRRPVAGDLGAAGVVVGVHQQDTHDSSGSLAGDANVSPVQARRLALCQQALTHDMSGKPDASAAGAAGCHARNVSCLACTIPPPTPNPEEPSCR